VATTELPAQEHLKLRHTDVDHIPACSRPGMDPSWWDMETHLHSNRFSCTPCQNAIETCRTCPIRAECADLGRRTRYPWLIYAGKAYGTNGLPMWACRRCRIPIVGPGRRRESGMCSRPCELNYDEAL